MSDLDPMPAGESIGESGFNQGSVAAPAMTAGALLRQGREASGMHIAALAVSLKVPVKKLEALEQDRFDLLPDSVFVRALASSVCRTLKLDSAAVLERLPQTSAPKLTYRGAGINAPFRSPGEGPGPSISTQVSRTAVLAGLALLLGALVLIFMPSTKQDAVSAKAEVDGLPPGSAEAAKPLPAVVAISSPVVGEIPSSNAPIKEPVAANIPAPAGLSVPTSAIPLSIAGLPSVAPASGSAAVAAASSPASAASQAAPSGIVTFHAKGESWVEVTDAKGTVVLRRTLTAGEVAGASGVLPMAAVVGRADATQVQVRGKAFDLGAVARDNVARFEVK